MTHASQKDHPNLQRNLPEPEHRDIAMHRFPHMLAGTLTTHIM